MSTTRFELSGFGGRLIHSDDAEYDEARKVFNGMIDRRPALIARCSSADDVVAAVNLAREQHLPLSVYGGGHGVTGSAMCDAGICVDLRGMQDVDVDTEHARRRRRGRRDVGRVRRGDAGARPRRHRRTRVDHGYRRARARQRQRLARAQVRLRLRQPDRGRGRHRRRAHRARLGRREPRPLLGSARRGWQLRHRDRRSTCACTRSARSCSAACCSTPPRRRRSCCRFYREFMRNAPDEVGCGLAFITAPPEEFVPEPVRGQPVIGDRVLLRGPDRGRRGRAQAAARLRSPGLDLVQPMPYVAVQQLLDPAAPKGMQNYWTADFYDDLPDEAVDILVERGTHPVSPLTQIIMVPGGGAIARVDEDATAFGQRNAAWNIHYLSMWPDPADTEKNIAYTTRIRRRDEAVEHRPCVPELPRRRRRRAASRPRSVPRSSRGCRRSRTSGTRRTCSASTRTSHRARTRRNVAADAGAHRCGRVRRRRRVRRTHRGAPAAPERASRSSCSRHATASAAGSGRSRSPTARRSTAAVRGSAPKHDAIFAPRGGDGRVDLQDVGEGRAPPRRRRPHPPLHRPHPEDQPARRRHDRARADEARSDGQAGPARRAVGRRSAPRSGTRARSPGGSSVRGSAPTSRATCSRWRCGACSPATCTTCRSCICCSWCARTGASTRCSRSRTARRRTWSTAAPDRSRGASPTSSATPCAWSAPVRSITQRDDRVVVDAADARRVGAPRRRRDPARARARDRRSIRCSPTTASRSTATTVAGPETKTLVVYDEPFWRADGFSGQTAEPGSAAEVTLDASPASGTPGVIASFTFGPVAEAARRARSRRAAHARCSTR